MGGTYALNEYQTGCGMNSSSAIVARGLQKKFGAVTAAADLQIEIAHGA